MGVLFPNDDLVCLPINEIENVSIPRNNEWVPPESWCGIRPSQWVEFGFINYSI